MVATDIRRLFRCANTDPDANASDHANSNPNTAKLDPCTDTNAYLDAGFDICTDINTDTNAYLDAGFDSYTDFNTDTNACIHADADRDSCANEYANDYTDFYDTGTGNSRPDRPAGSERSDSELECRCRRNPLRTMVLDRGRRVGSDRP